MSLDVNSLFEVTLSENPTTGYSWIVLDSDLKVHKLDTVLKLIKESYQSNPPPGEMIVGYGGFKTLTFDVIGAGQGDLDLYYARSWEIEKAIENKQDLTEYLGMIIPVKAEKEEVIRCGSGCGN